MVTEREKFEQEVTITARVPKSVNFDGQPLEIIGIPWHVVERIGDSVVNLFRPLFELAARSVGSAGGDAGTADRLASATVDESFDPEIFKVMGASAKEAVKDLITYGVTGITWEEVQQYDFAMVTHLALEVLKYNIGPTLRKNFGSGTSDLLESFGMSLVPASSDSNTSSSPQATGSKK